MANEQFRIVDFDETSTVNSDDYILVDGNTAGTRKYNINSISGSMPESYAGLTELIEDEYLVADTENHTLVGSFTVGYSQDMHKVDQYGALETWGDTESDSFISAFNSLCSRVATIESDGSLPQSYIGLTTLLENEHLVADTEQHALKGKFIGDITCGYQQDFYRTDQSTRLPWGDTEAEPLSVAIDDMCERIAALEASGGGLPECYAGLTTLLDHGGLVTDTENGILVGDFATGYLQDIYKLDENSERVTWGDTEQEQLSSAINDICNRLATIETGGTLPASYAGLTAMLENNDIRFDDESITLALTGYHMKFDVSTAHVYDSTGWGDTQDTDLGVAIGNICSRIETLEDGGTLRSLTELVDEGYIEFDNQSAPYEMSFDNANIHLNASGDILRTGYWAEGVSDSSSLVQALSEIATYISNESDELDTLTETVSGLSSTVDNLSSDLSHLSGDVDTISGTVDTLSSDVSGLQSMLSGFVDNDVSFDEVNNLCIADVNLKLSDANADIVTGYWTYWGQYEDEEAHQTMPGTSTNSLIEAFQYVCKKLDEYEARITALENDN